MGLREAKIVEDEKNIQRKYKELEDYQIEFNKLLK